MREADELHEITYGKRISALTKLATVPIIKAMIEDCDVDGITFYG